MGDSQCYFESALRELIPELRESEDERIRQWLIDYYSRMKWHFDSSPNTKWLYEDEMPCKDIIAWLEKQKDSKWSPSRDEMGVLYKLCYLSNQITDEDDTKLTRLYQDLKREYFNGHSFENMFPSEKQKEQKPIIQDVELNDAVYDYVRDHFIAGADFTPEYIKKLMENAFFAGVDYYLLKQESESCEPDTNVEKVIEDVICVYGKTQGEWVGGYDVDTLIVNLRRAFNKKEQKPAEWSKNDTVFLEEITDFFENKTVRLQHDLDMYAHWLKSLPERFNLQPKFAEWSDTDNIGWDEAFTCVTRAEKAAKNEEELQNAVTAEKWLKEIKFKYYVHPVKQGWSEEDEEIIYSLRSFLIQEEQSGRYGSVQIAQIEQCLNWLKSLRPQIIDSTPLYTIEQVDEKIREAQEWKPSEEQMKALLNIEGDLRAFQYNDKAKIIAELYEHLKKLM